MDTYEKKYKDLIARLQKAKENDGDERYCCVIDEIAPEPQESEDEKIRKGIISFIQDHIDEINLQVSGDYDTRDKEDIALQEWCKRALAWLEKQKEYESTDFEYVWDRTDCGELTSALDKYSEEAIINMCHAWYDKGIELERKAWLEKQGESYTKRDVDDAFVEGMAFAKHELEKQGEKDRFIKEEIECIKGYRENAIKKLEELEKQCEQKETLCDKCKKAQPSHSCQDITALGRCYIEGMNKSNKVEPKFHEGDILKHNKANIICKVLSANVGFYSLMNILGGDEMELFNVEKNFHLWTIADAKDGDVLAAKECYVIFKEVDGLNIKCHCTYHYMGFNPSFHINTLQNKTAFQPATKEQRDLLFTKMKEAGYKWSDKDRKLIKIVK